MSDRNARGLFGCPQCRQEDISENNTVSVRLRVSEWTSDGEPSSFSYPWSIIDDTMTTDEDGFRFHCNDCGFDFEEALDLRQPTTQQS